MFCSDLTSVQQDYNAMRDKCRKYAQIKVESDISTGPSEERLIGAFSECMGKNGWDVPSGLEGAAAKPVAMPGFPPVGTAPVAPQEAAPQQQTAPAQTTPVNTTPQIQRTSECAFARHSASVSSNARARAKACDVECAQRLKLDPDGPRPAACPAETDPSITPNMRKR